MNSIFSKHGFQPGHRPPAAVEISPDGVLAAALPAPGQPPVYAFEPLPANSLHPGIGEPNVKADETVSNAIRAALGAVSPRTRSVTLVVPDTAVRVFVLDFDTLPTRPAESDPVVRFRLRKMVPFEVEHSGVSYQILHQSKTECKVLAAVIPAPILADYEAVVRAAGYEPGAVLPSSLAALATIDSLEAALIANLSSIALTTSITNGSDLQLYRTLDLPLNPELHLQEVQRGIAVAAAYFEDKLGAPPTRLLYSGNEPGEEFARWIDNPELTITDLVPRPETGAVTSLGHMSIAGVTGALAGAR